MWLLVTRCSLDQLQHRLRASTGPSARPGGRGAATSPRRPAPRCGTAASRRCARCRRRASMPKRRTRKPLTRRPTRRGRRPRAGGARPWAAGRARRVVHRRHRPSGPRADRSGWPATSSAIRPEARRRRRWRSAARAGRRSPRRPPAQASAKRSWPMKRAGLAVVDDVGDLGPDEVVVDRREVPAGLHGGEVQGEHLDAVGQHGGDAVARA